VGKPLLDPTKEEEQEGSDSMTLGVMASTGEVTQWILEGRREVGGLSSALELATDGCAIVLNMMRRRLLKNVETAVGKGEGATGARAEGGGAAGSAMQLG
jgi:NTP pyrophosphatase (non-canonical NTP hydrolase)